MSKTKNGTSGKRGQGRNKHRGFKLPGTGARFSPHDCNLLRHLFASPPQESNSSEGRASVGTTPARKPARKRPRSEKSPDTNKGKIIGGKFVLEFTGVAGKKTAVLDFELDDEHPSYGDVIYFLSENAGINVDMTNLGNKLAPKIMFVDPNTSNPHPMNDLINANLRLAQSTASTDALVHFGSVFELYTKIVDHPLQPYVQLMLNVFKANTDVTSKSSIYHKTAETIKHGLEGYNQDAILAIKFVCGQPNEGDGHNEFLSGDVDFKDLPSKQSDAQDLEDDYLLRPVFHQDESDTAQLSSEPEQESDANSDDSAELSEADTIHCPN